jgi:hypothetical protein
MFEDVERIKHNLYMREAHVIMVSLNAKLHALEINLL